MAAALGAPVFVRPAEIQTNTGLTQQPMIGESVSAAQDFGEIISQALLDVQSPTESTTFRYPQEREWTEGCEQRFHELAVAEAVGEISNEQLAELESLTRLREVKGAGRRNLEEILLEIRQWKAAVSLLSQLSNYVRVIGPRT